MTMRRVPFLIAGLLLILGVCPTRSHAVTRISADISFYDDLSPYGSWEHVSRYGDCWVPYRHASAWRPYTVGYWVDTDYGWLWVSEDPWGDIPYHYGRWAYDPYYSWIWVPDDDLVWAPAWVSWRYDDDYVGWAALPPDAGWGGSGLTINVSLLDRRINRSAWCFTPMRSFGTTRVRYSILPTTRNVTLLAQTRNMTRYESVNSYPVNRGVPPEIVARATGRRVQPYHITDAGRGDLRKANIQGRTIEVYRPSIVGARRERAKFVPLGKGGASNDVSRRDRVQQGRQDVRTRQDRGVVERQQQRDMRQRGQDRARENEIRRQQQSETRMKQESGAQRRQEQGQRQYRERGQGGNQGQGQGGPPPDQGQGGVRGRGRDQGGKGQDQNGKGKDQGGKGQDQGGKGQDKSGKDRGQDQGDDQGQGNDQDKKDHGRGHGG